jgi:predicted Zn-dependent protease
MWRSGASEAIARVLPPSCKNLQRACRPQMVIKLPKKKYTPKQDVQLGKEAASEVRKQYPIIEDQHIAKYLTQIGNRLVAAAPTELKQSVYEYSFTPVNLKDINAFALPGGPMFVQRGMFDAAAEEAEVAGVMAHELSRVLLRHGTRTRRRPRARGCSSARSPARSAARSSAASWAGTSRKAPSSVSARCCSATAATTRSRRTSSARRSWRGPATTRARSLMRQVEARQFGSTRPQPGSKWRCSGPPSPNRCF